MAFFKKIRFKYSDANKKSMVGIQPNFTPLDVLRALFLIEENVSRQSLVKKLELGEGTVRSVLDILKQKRLIASTQQGHSLTDKGNLLLAEIKGHISAPKKARTEFYKNKKQVALLVKTKQPAAIATELRDIAIRRGATAAIILTYANNDFYAEGLEDCDFSSLKEIFDCKQNNTLIITFAAKESEAENAALAVAMEIDSKLNAELAMAIEF